jgi:hypothetical protein
MWLMQDGDPEVNKHKHNRQEQVIRSSKVKEWGNHRGDARFVSRILFLFRDVSLCWRGAMPQRLPMAQRSHLLLRWTYHKGESTTKRCRSRWLQNLHTIFGHNSTTQLEAPNAISKLLQRPCKPRYGSLDKVIDHEDLGLQVPQWNHEEFWISLVQW